MTPKEYMRKAANGIGYFRDPEMYVWHRERGLPTYESHSGEEKSYYENNRVHRLNGFALDWRYYKTHCLNGKKLFGIY